jgi:excisionase family DNA binding protein
MIDNKLLSIKDAAKYLGVCKLTLRNWDKAGKLKAIRNTMNKYRYYRKEDLDKVYNYINEKVL